LPVKKGIADWTIALALGSTVDVAASSLFFADVALVLSACGWLGCGLLVLWVLRLAVDSRSGAAAGVAASPLFFADVALVLGACGWHGCELLLLWVLLFAVDCEGGGGAAACVSSSMLSNGKGGALPSAGCGRGGGSCKVGIRAGASDATDGTGGSPGFCSSVCNRQASRRHMDMPAKSKRYLG